MYKILMVDDEKKVTDLLVNFLNSNNYQAIGAINSKEAFLALERYRPDIIILDLNLQEEVTGIEVLRKAKQLNPNVEVIVLTGVGDNGANDEALASGARIVIHKPATVTEMLDIINELAKNLSQ